MSEEVIGASEGAKTFDLKIYRVTYLQIEGEKYAILIKADSIENFAKAWSEILNIDEARKILQKYGVELIKVK